MIGEESTLTTKSLVQVDEGQKRMIISLAPKER
jgi:hypothetical protein